MWLLALDMVGFLLLGLGVAMHFLPEAALSQALPATLRLPLLIIGGGMVAAGWTGMDGPGYCCRCWRIAAVDGAAGPNPWILVDFASRAHASRQGVAGAGMGACRHPNQPRRRPE
jgi:hypothetical protein